MRLAPEQTLRLLLKDWSGVAFGFCPLAPERQWSVDVAFPELKLAVEVDGWEFHGKHLEGFKRDREKDRALTLAGWRVLRFYASEITKAPGDVLAQIIAMQARILKEKGHETVR